MIRRRRGHDATRRARSGARAARRVADPASRDLRAQIDGTISNLQAALGLEGATIADGVRFKVYYTPAKGMDEWAVRAAIQSHGAFASLDPLPALSMMPVPLQPFAGQAVQIQAIAIVGWRHGPRAHAQSHLRSVAAALI